MSNDNVTPEESQEVESVKKNKKGSYNGLYRKNNRINKKDKTLLNNSELDVQNNTISVPELSVIEQVKLDIEILPVKIKKTFKPVLHKNNKIIVTSISHDDVENQNLEQKKPKHIHKNKKPNIHLYETPEEINTVRSAFHELLYLIRQKNSNNDSGFFLELESVLKSTAFEDIEESNLSLFGFSCLYERDGIFKILCENFPDKIQQSDIERTIRVCINKREETISNLIDVYKERFKPSLSFIESLIDSISLSSYRENNNLLILNWITNHMTENEYNLFWSKCIENRNLPLMQVSLKNNKVKEYLNSHIKTHLDGFKTIGFDYTIIKALNKKQDNFIENTEVVNTIKRTSYLGNQKEQMQNINQKLIGSEDKKPLIVFKNNKNKI